MCETQGCRVKRLVLVTTNKSLAQSLSYQYLLKKHENKVHVLCSDLEVIGRFFHSVVLQRSEWEVQTAGLSLNGFHMWLQRGRGGLQSLLQLMRIIKISCHHPFENDIGSCLKIAC